MTVLVACVNTNKNVLASTDDAQVVCSPPQHNLTSCCDWTELPRSASRFRAYASVQSAQPEELRACLKEYADINIWQLEKSAAGEDTIAFYESARPYTADS